MKIFVVISLFNEEKHIANVLKNLIKYKLPVVVVDDGSTDNSILKINELLCSSSLKSKWVKLLEHQINLGKGAAMKTGAEWAFAHGANAIIFMDSDGQHMATDLPKFINAFKKGECDIIFGSRNLGMGVPLVRYMGNKVASVVTAFLFGSYVSDSLCGFRGLTIKGYKKIKWDSKGYGVEIEMVARVGKRKIKYVEIPVETVYLDEVKGVTLLDAFGILGEVLKWKLTL